VTLPSEAGKREKKKRRKTKLSKTLSWWLKYNKKTMIKVVAAVIEQKGKFLLAQRKKGGVHGGCWEFPGGKLEKGEKPEGALGRELKEELGVEIEVGELFLSFPFQRKGLDLLFFVYWAKWKKGKIKPVDHEQVKWLGLEEIRDYPLAEPDFLIVDQLKKKHNLTVPKQ